MSLYPSSSKTITEPRGITEFEILKASHKFLREDDDTEPSGSRWEEQLAAKYYNNLYREFAVCNLKHYKTGNFSLRWRTEEEVLSGAGETTCGNTRCRHHDPPRRPGDVMPSLSTLELPFAYEEHGERKSALVKVVLCSRCVDKLMWKRRKDKERAMMESSNSASSIRDEMQRSGSTVISGAEDGGSRGSSKRHHRHHRNEEDEEKADPKRTSRSRSPRRGDSVSSQTEWVEKRTTR